MRSLSGKRALVTGAGRRVGAEVAIALGRAGIDVVVHYHRSREGADDTVAAIEQAGARAWAVSADLSDRAQAADLVDEAVRRLGGLDLLVLGAANFERVGFEQVDFAGDGPGSWDSAMSLNVTALAVMAQRAAAALRAAHGSIVIVTCAARRAPYRDYLPYHVSKAAAHQLMRVLAVELAPEVRVNAVAPGTVLPPPGLSREDIDAIERRIPLGRCGNPGDVADAVVYLARADWVTGEELLVDGGRALC